MKDADNRDIPPAVIDKKQQSQDTDQGSQLIGEFWTASWLVLLLLAWAVGLYGPRAFLGW